MPNDYYTILHVQPQATSEEIHRAYRALALQHHPDRNSTPEAAATMTAINEAYSVLADPSRRRNYDLERSGGEGAFDIAGPILSSAREILLRQGWIASHEDGVNIILEKDLRAVRVSLLARLDNGSLKKVGRQFAGFTVVLAVEIETPINLSLHTAVVDLLHSRHHGAPFPDETYRMLFAPFLQ
jgi:curved DNA-binding protein CbpA